MSPVNSQLSIVLELPARKGKNKHTPRRQIMTTRRPTRPTTRRTRPPTRPNYTTPPDDDDGKKNYLPEELQMIAQLFKEFPIIGEILKFVGIMIGTLIVSWIVSALIPIKGIGPVRLIAFGVGIYLVTLVKVKPLQWAIAILAILILIWGPIEYYWNEAKEALANPGSILGLFEIGEDSTSTVCKDMYPGTGLFGLDTDGDRQARTECQIRLQNCIDGKPFWRQSGTWTQECIAQLQPTPEPIPGATNTPVPQPTNTPTWEEPPTWEPPAREIP